MNQQDWGGVMPAITTPFTPAMEIDEAFVRRHVAWLVGHGCTGIITPGSLGEGATLTADEKRRLWRACAEGVGGRVHVVAAIASASTAEGVTLAREAEACGCSGLMVLPAYTYKGSAREARGHVGAIMRATTLSCMLYNNPIAYGTDFTAQDAAWLAGEHPNLHAVKESSGDVRRISALREVCGDRLRVLVGMDDLVLEGVSAGAVGWVAGLVNALPGESVRLFGLCERGDHARAWALYRWFLPLLRMDTTYDFVQLIKLVQREVGMVGEGGARVRPPRLMPEGEELGAVLARIRAALAGRPGT